MHNLKLLYPICFERGGKDMQFFSWSLAELQAQVELQASKN